MPELSSPTTATGVEPHSPRPRFEVADIVRTYGEAFRATHPVSPAFYYPQVSPPAAKSQPWVKSVNRFHPRHRRIVPGCPSFFLVRNPPSRAIQRIASCRVGGWEGRVVVLCTVQ